MTCHSQIWTGSEMLQPVRDSLAKSMPLVWARLNELPSYVYFNHSIHITKGIGCTRCHRNPEKFVRTQAEGWDMNWSPPDDQVERGKVLVADYHISGAGRLTDCSICHR